MTLCYDCQRPTESKVTDGLVTLCDECARIHSNLIYNKLLRAFEECEELDRKAFLRYGWEDFAYAIDEEKENA